MSAGRSPVGVVPTIAPPEYQTPAGQLHLVDVGVIHYPATAPVWTPFLDDYGRVFFVYCPINREVAESLKQGAILTRGAERTVVDRVAAAKFVREVNARVYRDLGISEAIDVYSEADEKDEWAINRYHSPEGVFPGLHRFPSEPSEFAVDGLAVASPEVKTWEAYGKTYSGYTGFLPAERQLLDPWVEIPFKFRPPEGWLLSDRLICRVNLWTRLGYFVTAVEGDFDADRQKAAAKAGALETASWAAQGALMGAKFLPPVGPIVGAIVGFIAGIIDSAFKSLGKGSAEFAGGIESLPQTNLPKHTELTPIEGGTIAASQGVPAIRKPLKPIKGGLSRLFPLVAENIPVGTPPAPGWIERLLSWLR